MRRKSERTASKKAKASPEKKIEKVKRTRSRRSKKQSTSSENESADDSSPVHEAEPAPATEVNPPKTPVKEGNQEEAQDHVWRVKAAEGAGDTGEIQKLKICLTRPPTTPERVDRSPRSKRKHSRATSSSDGTPSGEAPEEKRKSKHRVKRSHRESKDESEKTQESQDDEPESEMKTDNEPEIQSSSDNTQNEAEGKVDSSENTISTTNEEAKGEKANVDSTDDSTTKEETEKSEDKTDKDDKATDADTSNMERDDKASDADTTVDSPRAGPTVVSATPEPKSPTKTETQDSQAEEKSLEPESPTRRRSASVDKSEILELHPEESKVELDIEDKTKLEKSPSSTQDKDKVSKSQDKTPNEEPKSISDKSTNKTGVVVSSESEKRSRIKSTDSVKSQNEENRPEKSNEDNRKSYERSDSVQSNQEEHLHNGQAAPLVISRKRRWGSRSSKITKQKSITISTDILKDIIPDVKPVEFEEVVDEKKHKRVVTERVERPILPKIVIDNSENVQRAEQERNTDKKDHEEKDIVKPRDLASSRKISIIKENDSIITRPPSPPRHKQSCILYITNLVRPFTLLQLKNLLQRTGRIVENGFWIDRIKSKCYVIYESEDQAVETRHALHGVTWPVSNPKTLQVDFSTQEAFDKAKTNEDSDNAQASTIPGTVEDWLREQDMKRERGEVEKPWERKMATREWDLGKNEKDKEKEKERVRRDERPPLDKRRHRSPERSPEPARKFKKKEEEAPAKLLDDLFKKTKTTPCIYWLPLSAETIAIKEEQRRQHMAEHERRMQEQRRTHRRH